MDTRLKIATAASVASIVVAALALSLSPASAGHGFWMSSDDFEATSKVDSHYQSKNIATVKSNTNQTAVTGNVDVVHNDDYEGDAGTGSAANEAETSNEVSAKITPASMPSMPAMDLSDADALEEWDDVTLSSSISSHVMSENTATVNNNTNQTAVSGSVDIHCNDDVTGNATTGDATNTSSISTTISLSN